MHWTSALMDDAAIARLFPEGLPTLEAVRVHEFGLSREGPQATLRFDLAAYPADPPEKWRRQGFDTVQLTLLLGAVHEVSLRRFGHDPVADLELARDTVATAAPVTGLAADAVDFSLRLTAEAAFLANVSAYAGG